MPLETSGNDRKQRKIALVIDGDNAQPAIIDHMLRETEKYGSITIRRIYGDWTTPSMNGWKKYLHMNAIQPVQQFRYTVGKNATDSAMIIDSMDILHSGLVDGFCIISSDSDYTRLATRIREDGFFAMGIGDKKTPKAFVKACDVFVYTENIIPDLSKEKKKKGKKEPKDDTEDPIPILVEAYEMTSQEDLWVNLADLGNSLRKIDPSFDPRTYGYKRLSQLIKNLPKKFKLRFEDEKGATTVWVMMLE